MNPKVALALALTFGAPAPVAPHDHAPAAKAFRCECPEGGECACAPGECHCGAGCPCDLSVGCKVMQGVRVLFTAADGSPVTATRVGADGREQYYTPGFGWWRWKGLTSNVATPPPAFYNTTQRGFSRGGGRRGGC